MEHRTGVEYTLVVAVASDLFVLLIEELLEPVET